MGPAAALQRLLGRPAAAVGLPAAGTEPQRDRSAAAETGLRPGPGCPDLGCPAVSRPGPGYPEALAMGLPLALQVVSRCCRAAEEECRSQSCTTAAGQWR